MRYDLMAVIGVLVVIWALCLGCGLALERLLRLRLDNALVIPLGLCVALVLIFPGYVAGAGDVLAVALLVAVALAGFLFAKDGLRARLNPGWAGAAALAAYVLYMLPVIAYGHWTWSGYDFVNDTSFEMLFASHIKGYGTTLGNIPETSEREFLASYLSSAYPLGAQSLLATISGLTDTPVEVLYQGFIAALAATGALALSTLTRGLLDARRAAFVGFVAISANLTYQYALQGGIKEIGLLATLCAAAALARAAILLDRPYAGAVLIAVPAAAALATYNAVAVPFLGALVLFVGLGVVLMRRIWPAPRWVGPVALGACLTAVLAIPSLITFQTFFQVANSGQGSTGVGAIQFGQLLRALPLSQLSGVWLAGEYRLAIAPHNAGLLTAIASAVILLAILPSLAWALWRRDTGLLLILGMIGLVLLIVYPKVSPYGQGKLLAIASPAVVLVALAGLLSVRGQPAAMLALAAGVALALAIGASDLLAYSHDRVAPTERMEAIEQTGDHFKGEGLVLWNEYEEFAKYFARAAKISVPFEPKTPEQAQLRLGGVPFGYYFDLDQELLAFVEQYPIIVTRRSPAASRPPANYRLVYQNEYYLGWRRSARPQVLSHLPEQQLYAPSQPVACSALEPVVAGAPKGSELIVALDPELAWFPMQSDTKRSRGWVADPGQAGAVLTTTGGHAQGVLTVKGDGPYAVWVQGDFPRAADVYVDGRKVGSVSGSNTPEQWLQAASLRLRPGRHLVRVFEAAGRAHFGPGEFGTGLIGAVALQRQKPERLQTVPLSRWRSLCGTVADWVELVRP
ncbi:MAG TPA: hypothetical protein VFC30_05970 [Solirubrobacteraceae bacterium]|nr:hypothetical protein [Solirubrobacteraceae bacterium]